MKGKSTELTFYDKIKNANRHRFCVLNLIFLLVLSAKRLFSYVSLILDKISKRLKILLFYKMLPVASFFF